LPLTPTRILVDPTAVVGASCLNHLPPSCPLPPLSSSPPLPQHTQVTTSASWRQACTW
jgi:hypothetical protein